MKRTKRNLLRALALLMAFGMAFSLSMLFASSPPVILASVCATSLVCARMFRTEQSTTAPNARGRPVFANGDPMPEQYATRSPRQRSQRARVYPVGFRCRSCTMLNIDDPAVTANDTSTMAQTPSGAYLAESLVVQTANLFAYNANDQGVRSLPRNMNMRPDLTSSRNAAPICARIQNIFGGRGHYFAGAT